MYQDGVTKSDVAQAVVESWDLQELIDFAINTLVTHYEENREAFDSDINYIKLVE